VGAADVIRRRARSLVVAGLLGLALVPAARAQTGRVAPPPPGADDPRATQDGSRPVTAPAAAGGRQVQIQHLDAIFESMPVPFDREVAFSSDNLHFVPIKTQKGTMVLAWGGVGEGDAVRFAAAMAAARPVLEVQFYSPGGDLLEGMKIGRAIRKLQLATRITSGAWCASACDFMFLGGTVRTVEPGGKFGVHMFSTNQAEALVHDLATMPTSVDEFNDRYPKHALKRYQVQAWVDEENTQHPTNKIGEQDFFRQGTVYKAIVDERVRDIQQYSAQTAANIALFLVEMRLSLRFLVEFADQTSYGLRVLTPDELHSYNVVTN
jgi:hypothetical protein